MMARHLAENYDRYKEELPERIESKAKELLELLPVERTPQIERCTDVFALVAVAGEIAQEIGLFPECMDTNETVRIMFKAWSSARSSVTQSTESSNIVKNVYR